MVRQSPTRTADGAIWNGLVAALSADLRVLDEHCGYTFIVCVTGLVGLFTRTSSVLALFTSFYVLGVPEFYGTVEHYNHLLWFLAILTVSRSGDALSIDAILRTSTRTNQEATTLPQPSVIYSLPLRFACLLMGAIYFFPGLWKVRICGFDWAFSENLRYQMYARWMDLDGWTPFFRLDLHPWLYKSIALGTLVFELSFIFVVFFPRLRIVLALVGLGFHFGSGLFMRIPFFDLWICYVALFDVSRWLAARGAGSSRGDAPSFMTVAAASASAQLA